MTGSLHPAAGIPDDVPDLARFADAVAAQINSGVLAQAADHDQAPVFISRAPGRLDVMGGIADYSGALVLQWPIREATRVALRPWRERRIVIVSIGPQGHTRRCEVPLDAGRRRGTPVRGSARLVRRGSDPALGGVCGRRVPCAGARACRHVSSTAPPS